MICNAKKKTKEVHTLGNSFEIEVAMDTLVLEETTQLISVLPTLTSYLPSIFVKYQFSQMAYHLDFL